VAAQFGQKVCVVTSVRPVAIHSNRLLASLAQRDRALLDPHLKEVTLRVRDVLYESQDDIQQAYFPHHAMISILTVTDDGESIETAAIGPEGAVGALAGLGMRRVFGRAVVQIAGSASRISATQLQLAARESDRIRDMILRSNEALTIQAQQTAACGALHDVEARLARWLLQAQDRSGSGAFQLIQEFLAQVLGVRRTTINLAVRALQGAGLIRYRRGQIEILDRSGLMNQSCSCYRIVRRQLDQTLTRGKA
jgi:CRP-like cAMP-binding protein